MGAGQRRVSSDRPVVRWITAIVLVLVSVAAVLIVFDGNQVGLATNSDMLLPAAWANTIFHDHYSLRSFQLPRTTSLFPDIAVHTALQLATGSWRLASLVYGWIQVVALIAAATWIIRQITGAPWLLGAAIFTLILVILFALDSLGGYGDASRTRLVTEIAAHGGAFLLTLFGAVFACRILTQQTTLLAPLALFGISAAAYFSDQLTVFELDAPLVLGLLCVRHDIDWRKAIPQVLAPLTFGVIAAELLLHLFNRQGFSPDWGHPLHLLRDSDITVAALWYLPALILALPLLPNKFSGHLLSGLNAMPSRFYWCFGATASLSTFGVVLVLLYSNGGGFRYFYALAWWPMILAAALIAASVRPKRYAASIAACVALGVVVPRVPHHAPAILSWTSPLANCLAAHRAQQELGAGLATYWLARQTEASSNWSIPMEAIVPDGSFYYWGNDKKRYLDLFPKFNFVVMSNIDPRLIRKRFGAPHTMLDCPDSQVWVYPNGQMAPHLSR